MKKPLVAVVGRPNVGKSTFFNKICGKRISIVKDTPGVTRDRIYCDAEWCGYNFSLVDTGGLDFKGKESFNENIKDQAQIAIDLADVIIFLVDGKEGLTAQDHEVSEYLRKSKKPCVLIVNKLDKFEVEKTYEFYELGMGEPYPISCAHSKGLGDALDAVVANFDRIEVDEDSEVLKIAIVGKPNAGKSSITNRLLNEDRVIVSDVAGTTRDAIDTPFTYNGQDFTVIDTAGMRKNSRIDLKSVESYSVIRAVEAIKRADVVLIVVDASEPISEQDVRIAGMVDEAGKPSIVVMNKWDLVEKDDKTINKYKDMLKEKMQFMKYMRTLFISALTGKRVNTIMPEILKVYENASRKLKTVVLNEILQEAIISNEPPTKNGMRLKIKYTTQVASNPPTFLLFCNNAGIVHFSYLRYLENRLRLAVDFEGTPIKLIARDKSEKED